MKKILLLIFTTITLNGYSQITFADANFKTALIDKGVDTNTDGDISLAEAQAVTELNIGDKNISEATEINNFTNLTDLTIAANNLSELNLTALTKLVSLNASSNSKPLTVNVSTNAELDHINLQGSSLICIDLSMLTKLKTVYLNNNPIAGVIDISKNTSIIVFQAASCPNITKNCIPVGAEAAASPGNFVKDPASSWSESCAANEGMTCPKVTTSVKNYTEGKFQVKPTLFSDVFTLDIDEAGEFDVVIIDLLGNIVSSKNGLQKGSYSLGTNLLTGMYIVKVTGSNKIKTVKIQKM